MGEVRHVQSLDAVRAIAIVGVLLVHAGAPGMGAGWLGVDLFFALSGFLITTLLLSEHARTGEISYRKFLVRRCLRLVPAYLLYVSIVTYGIWGWAGSERWTHGGWSPEAYTLALWTYVVNFAPAGGIWNGQIISVHLWSLAVEQQYYLVWPLVVMALAGRPRVLLTCGLLLTIATVLAFVLLPPSQQRLTLLHTRGFTLVMASTAAIAAMHYRDAIARLPWRSMNLAASVLVGAAVFLSAFDLWSEQQVMDRLLPFLSAAFIVWIVALWYLPLSPRIAPFMLNPMVKYIGEVSYGIYLYHELVRVAVWYFAKPAMTGWPTSLGYAVRLIAYIALSTAVAAISYELIEKRFLQMRGRFRA